MIGICNLSNIPLRHEPDSRSEMISQLLFGETFEIIENTKDWTKVVTHFDTYSGWISSKQFEIPDTPIQSNVTAGVFPFLEAALQNSKIFIPPGANLPDLIKDNFRINKNDYKLTAPNTLHTISGLASIAMQYLNVPYLWGGRTPSGIDCSGFTQTVFKQIGINLRRDAYQQADSGETVNFIEEIKQGDLAFFDNEEDKIIHVGILLDKRRIIHASGRVRIDEIDNFGILNPEINGYSHKLRIIKRMF